MKNTIIHKQLLDSCCRLPFIKYAMEGFTSNITFLQANDLYEITKVSLLDFVKNDSHFLEVFAEFCGAGNYTYKFRLLDTSNMDEKLKKQLDKEGRVLAKVDNFILLYVG